VDRATRSFLRKSAISLERNVKMNDTDAAAALEPRFVRALKPFQQFAKSESAGAVVLLGAAAIAMAWANSPAQSAYVALWNENFVVGPAAHPLTLSLLHWINDGLMTLFFLVVGLELKREFLVGELAAPRHALLPILAALGGMLVPAVVYLALNLDNGAGRAGWGVPMATDIAFALGVLRLLGPRVPPGLTVFLAALAIVDDLGAVVVIALFYTQGVSLAYLGWAAAAVGVLFAFNRFGVRWLTAYMVVGVALWYALHHSGLHATIAGVLVALAVPVRTRINATEFSARMRGLLDEFDHAETGDLLVITSKGQQEAVHAMESASEGVLDPLLRLEHGLHPVVASGIMPLFALANAGVALGGIELGDAGVWVTAGVAAGLLLGKPLGIFGASWLAIRMGWAALPTNVSWSMLHGAAWLGGIGFTMALFIGGLAFGAATPLQDAAKVGVLSASLGAGIIGWLVLRRATLDRPLRG
jgi:Na+:H+ antiporter, NhaA family